MLRSALSDTMRQGLVTVNVAALVKLPGGKRPKALVWTVERETRWRQTVAAHVAAGKAPAEARVRTVALDAGTVAALVPTVTPRWPSGWRGGGVG